MCVSNCCEKCTVYLFVQAPDSEIQWWSLWRDSTSSPRGWRVCNTPSSQGGTLSTPKGYGEGTWTESEPEVYSYLHPSIWNLLAAIIIVLFICSFSIQSGCLLIGSCKFSFICQSSISQNKLHSSRANYKRRTQ